MEVEPSTGIPSGIPTVTSQSKKRKFGELESVQGTNSPDSKEILSAVHSSQIMIQEKEKNEKKIRVIVKRKFLFSISYK